MPIYEYRCCECGKLSTRLILRQEQAASITCPHCGGRQLDRLLSRFATPKSQEARMEAFADPSPMENGDDSDAAGMTEAMNALGAEFGQDMGENLQAMLDSPEDQGDEEMPSADDEPF